MLKRFFVFLLCCLCAANNNHARFLNQQNIRSFIIVLKEPSLSSCAFDEQGNCLYKGISTRENRYVGHLPEALSIVPNRKYDCLLTIIVARVFTKGGDSIEDSTPRDRNGHGTHVASCAAGSLNTVSPLGLISGFAPNAYLGNYKVFTDDFTTLEQIISALEACVKDGMDIVNLSLGSESYLYRPCWILRLWQSRMR